MGKRIPVLMQFNGEAVAVFQNRMHWSAVPPPEAMSPCWWGDQARALTAAWWSEKRIIGEVLFKPQMYSWLSLPPEASSLSSGDHFRPHICTLTTAEMHYLSEPLLQYDLREPPIIIA